MKKLQIETKWKASPQTELHINKNKWIMDDTLKSILERHHLMERKNGRIQHSNY